MRRDTRQPDPACDDAPVQPFPGLEHQPFDEGDGPSTAVLVHGFPGTPAEMRPVATALRAIGWRVRAPLLPGFGAEWASLATRRWGEWRASVAETLRAARCDSDRVLLVGFSMGAALALTSIHDEAATVDGLVLLAPFTRLPDRRASLLPIVKRFVPSFRPYATVDLDDPSVRAELTVKLGEIDLDAPSVRARVRRDVTVPTAAVDEVRKAGAHAWRVAPRLHPRPTLVVQGQRDTTVVPQSTVGLLRRFAFEPLRLFIADADHKMVLPDRPGHAEVLRAVQRFGHARLGRL